MRKRMFKTVTTLFMTVLMVCIFMISQAQQLETKYRVFNRNLRVDKKTGAVHLNKKPKVGIAWVIGKEFANGVIEFDVKGKDKFQGSFVGIAFHGLNDTTYESVYFRPFNFRASDLNRKAHAIQYMASPDFDWPKLRADFPNKYEQPISATVDPDQWFHVKIQVSESRVTVYINGSEQASLEVEALVNSPGKMIGYWVGNGSAGLWKNLKVTAAQ